MSASILHITSQPAWAEAQKSGQYAADSLAGQGFIHCSKPEQALRVADQVYSGQAGLILLVIDPERLTAALRWEPGADLATELFPHIYGLLNLDAVVQVVDFPCDGNGKFHLPVSLGFVEGG